MKTLDLIQGSPEWLAHRAAHFNASDAPAMLGVSPYKTRAELLRELHTGVPADVDVATQKRFDNGHRAEALARPLAEEIIGAELYPVTGTSDRLSASFDGLTLDESQVFEHKALNADLLDAFDRMPASQVPARDNENCRCLPIYHRVQMEQQLLVSGAERVLFMASEWTPDGELVEERHCWYYPDAELRQQVIDGWEQFAKDLAAYELPPAAAPAPVGKAPDALPALRIEITGAVTASNLAEFKATALGAIRSVNRDLQSDQDFADAEKAVKWCSEVESRLAAAKEHALSQTSTIEALFRAIDEIAGEARTVRLDLDKLVTRRKAELKEAEVIKAREALSLHLEVVNTEIAPARLAFTVDFGAAIKGLKSLDSVRAKLDAALAAAKIEVDGKARAIRANQAAFKAAAAGFEFLFADIATLVHKAADDFGALVQARIATHKAEQERKRLQAEEQARQQAEAKRLADEAAAAKRAATLQAAQTIATKLPEAVQSGAMDPQQAQRIGTLVANMTTDVVIEQAKKDEPATLKLGDINARLAPVKLDAAGMADLGVSPAKTEGAAKLYRESDFARLLRALAKHIDALQAVPA